MRPVNATGPKRGKIGFIRPKQAAARKPAPNGADFEEIAPRSAAAAPVPPD
jgi:hypothetical protein